MRKFMKILALLMIIMLHVGCDKATETEPKKSAEPQPITETMEKDTVETAEVTETPPSSVEAVDTEEQSEQAVKIKTPEKKSVGSDPKTFIEGQHYKYLADSSASKGREVIEYFMHSCPHCDTFDPLVERWRQTLPKDVTFKHVPTPFHPAAKLHAKAFYVAKELGIDDKIHKSFFHALHREKKMLASYEDLETFFKEDANIEPTVFKNLFYASFAVQNAMRHDTNIMKTHKVVGVPYIVVNGQYATSPSMLKGQADIFAVIDYLLEHKAQAVK